MIIVIALFAQEMQESNVKPKTKISKIMRIHTCAVHRQPSIRDKNKKKIENKKLFMWTSHSKAKKHRAVALRCFFDFVVRWSALRYRRIIASVVSSVYVWCFACFSSVVSPSHLFLFCCCYFRSIYFRL